MLSGCYPLVNQMLSAREAVVNAPSFIANTYVEIPSLTS
jgi:hypothetical protein